VNDSDTLTFRFSGEYAKICNQRRTPIAQRRILIERYSLILLFVRGFEQTEISDWQNAIDEQQCFVSAEHPLHHPNGS
jgi:hypothetical protein